MKAKIQDIAYHLPAHVVTNDALHEENPAWDMNVAGQRSGVVKRHVTSQTETALDLAFHACQDLFAVNPHAREQVDGIMFCTESPDYVVPPNACVLHGLLDLPEDVFAFDFTLACSGYVYGLALARGLMQSGLGKSILLVTAETYSKFTHKEDRPGRVLFGDGAAVSWITPSASSHGIIDVQCSTAGKHYDRIIVPAGGCRMPKSNETSHPMRDGHGNVRTLEHIYMDGVTVLAFFNSRLPVQIHGILDRNGLTIDDIDLFVFHQASQLVLDSLTRLLRINPDRVYANLREIGNTASASIPIALKQAWADGSLTNGSKVLLCGFGVGLSWGTAILEV